MVYIRSARFGRKYRRLMLFGSRARGDNDPESDADVAVILRGHIGDRWSVKRLIIEDTYPTCWKPAFISRLCRWKSTNSPILIDRQIRRCCAASSGRGSHRDDGGVS